ncbi:MAG: hypothetical protein MUF76_12260 [Hydrogenophaga sp.]|jgi:hypothetical protein|nr:hypothetical protein [Hydrogenophaga sp.]
MDILLIAFFLAMGLFGANAAEQRQRIALLASHLQKFQLEKLMEQLTSGYLRALGESDPERSDPIWRNLEATEDSVKEQLAQFAQELHTVWGERTRVSRLPMAVPWATRLFPAQSFDLRALVDVHANGFDATLRNDEGLSRRDRAFRLTAELLLFQHSCHWFCRSRSLASARLLALHKTAYEQVVAAVSPQTRQAYLAVVQG